MAVVSTLSLTGPIAPALDGPVHPRAVCDVCSGHRCMVCKGTGRKHVRGKPFFTLPAELPLLRALLSRGAQDGAVRCVSDVHFHSGKWRVTYQRLIHGTWMGCEQTYPDRPDAERGQKRILEQAIDKCSSCGGPREHWDGGCGD